VPQPELPTEALALPDALPDAPPPDNALAAGPVLRQPVKTLETATGTVILRRLTPEERAQRRARRNLILLVAGALLLFAFVLLFGR